MFLDPAAIVVLYLYADDILLLSLSVTQLEQLLHACECELTWLDMSINFYRAAFNAEAV